jgi:D-tyrosyl-tRNA(Tyr) deacylase
MIGLLQRVSSANVRIDNEMVASIETGLLVFIGVEKGDAEPQAERLAERLLNYRVFPDAAQKMNLSLIDIAGEVLLVPQFTLAADTSSGNRPGFSTAAPPPLAQALFEHLVTAIQQQYSAVQTGRFGADMQISLCNEGPVTFTLRTEPTDK